MFVMGEAMYAWGQGLQGKSLYLQCNLSEPKTSLKAKNILKIDLVNSFPSLYQIHTHAFQIFPNQ